jgi:hypothetical protein
VKLHKCQKGVFTFHLSIREKQALLKVLSLYPLIPDRHFSAQEGEQMKSKQLLEEALAEQRGENRAALQKLLDDPDRFEKAKSGCYLRLELSQVEWLLQVLNDVRVGSWLILGSPDHSKMPLLALDEKHLFYFWTMETSAYFESALLKGLGGH